MTETVWMGVVATLCSVVSVLAGAIAVLYRDRKDEFSRHSAEKESLRAEHRIEKDMLIEEHARTIKALEKAFNTSINYEKLANKMLSPITEKELRETKMYLEDRLNKQKTPTKEQWQNAEG